MAVQLGAQNPLAALMGMGGGLQMPSLSPSPWGTSADLGPLPPPAEDPAPPIDPKLNLANVLSEVVDQHFADSMNYMAAYYPRFQRYYQLYHSYVPQKTRPWRANIFIPISFANVEHGLATMLDAWYGTRPMQKVLPFEGNDWQDAEKVQNYLEWESDDMVSYLAHYEINKEMLMYGTAFSKTYWDFAKERNAVEGISIWNAFPDPAAEQLDEDHCEYFIQRAVRSPNWIRKMFNLGVYMAPDPQFDLEAVFKAGLQFIERAEHIFQLTGADPRRWRNRVEVLEEWRPGWVITILNRQYVVRARKWNGMMPISRWCDHALPHELLGIGEIELLEKLQEEINDMRNQRLDVVSMLINNMWIAARTANVDMDTLVAKPGQVVVADSTEGVKPLLQSGNPALSVQEEQISRHDVQEATGNWGYNQGQTPMRREAATTVLALQRASGMRFTAKVRYNEEAALRREGQIRIANAQRYMPAGKWVRILGKEGPTSIQMSPDEIPGRYDLVLQASTAIPKETKRAQVAPILSLLMASPKVNQDALLDWVLDLFEIRERQKFILSDEEMAMRMALMQAARGGLGNQTAAGGARRTGTGVGEPSTEGRTGQGLPDLGGVSASEENMPVGAGLLSAFLGGGG